MLFNGISPNLLQDDGHAARRRAATSPTPIARGAPEVIIVNEAFAKKYFNGENPIGRRFDIVGFNERFPTRHMEIIGMVGDTK